MITSSQNPKVKRIRRLLADRRFRHREQAFVVEGTRWLSEAVAANRQPEFLLTTERWLAADDNLRLLDQITQPPAVVAESILAAAGDTETPAGVLAVLPMVELPLPDRPTLLVILDRIADPGNLGTIIRTAAASGADGLLLAPGCVDPYNPKAIRATMGALLHLPVLPRPWDAIQQMTAKMDVWLAAAAGAIEYTDVDWRRPVALIIGGEAAGAGSQAHALSQGQVFLPMAPGTESLNAAAAAAVLLFETQRQRRSHPAAGSGA